MIKSILVVCMGNLCRSPVGERLLGSLLTDIVVNSAGLKAQQGMPVDPTMCLVAGRHGIDLAAHRAQKFTLESGIQHDLILVMEADHLLSMNQSYPELSGKTLLFGHMVGKRDIPDPYRKSNEYYQVIYQLLGRAACAWGNVLGSGNITDEHK
ncbi:protein tyrosine phosphatase [Enterobacteriaceae bacterium H11S18]|uniref:arsenate reductase/protein-tyrosine-phosphatase family protein n=1 Tax=Dryocola clanedunensis TaxID=2925396 RepID=UPI0022F03703|nr:protein tyrosine phosphatase [Dryocola clanedunensis]MCT4707430.1 protein tyrosine phosphatase [Dryocola clanedunensis]MCT4709823.1 protein tyrosine phosphatase [Dryocola clanedunensis]